MIKYNEYKKDDLIAFFMLLETNELELPKKRNSVIQDKIGIKHIKKIQYI